MLKKLPLAFPCWSPASPASSWRSNCLRELPPISTVQTLTECCHRFISTPRLCLVVADFTLSALATLQLCADTLLFLRNHCLVHVLFHDLCVFRFSLGRFELLVRVSYEVLWLYLTAVHASSEIRIRFVLQILEQRPHFVAVGFRSFWLVLVKCGQFDRPSHFKNVFWRCKISCQ